MTSLAIKFLEYAKHTVYTFFGFLVFHFTPRKKIVIVLSSMRSGSTLLKSLMGQAQDVSLLDEFHFIPYANHNKYFFYYLVYRLSDKPIIVLKKPFNNIASQLPIYGKVPLPDVLTIVLFRNPYETLLSLKTMQNRKKFKVFSDEECINYWRDTYNAILSNVDISRNTLFVQYEKLASKPIEETRRIFEFIGSCQHEGVEEYREYAWKPGMDDDSAKIRSGSIHQAKAASPDTDPNLYTSLKRHIETAKLLDRMHGLSLSQQL